MEDTFKIGDKVTKPKGHKFPGTVVARFLTTSGETRYVVELNELRLLHIFSAGQLALLP